MDTEYTHGQQDEAEPQTARATGIVVHVNRRQIRLDGPTISGADLIAAAGFDGTAWDLLELQGEGDPSGGELILATTIIELRPGQHFRVIPGDRSFGGQ